VNYSGPEESFIDILTPQNTSDIQRLLRQAQQGDSSSPYMRAISKSAISALADLCLIKATNQQLMTINQRKQRKGKQSNAELGVARVMSGDTVQERQQWAIAKADAKQKTKDERAYNKKVKALLHLDSDIFLSPKRPNTPKRLAVKAASKRALKPPASIALARRSATDPELLLDALGVL